MTSYRLRERPDSQSRRRPLQQERVRHRKGSIWVRPDLCRIGPCQQCRNSGQSTCIRGRRAPRDAESNSRDCSVMRQEGGGNHKVL